MQAPGLHFTKELFDLVLKHLTYPFVLFKNKENLLNVTVPDIRASMSVDMVNFV